MIYFLLLHTGTLTVPPNSMQENFDIAFLLAHKSDYMLQYSKVCAFAWVSGPYYFLCFWFCLFCFETDSHSAVPVGVTFGILLSQLSECWVIGRSPLCTSFPSEKEKLIFPNTKQFTDTFRSNHKIKMHKKCVKNYVISCWFNICQLTSAGASFSSHTSIFLRIFIENSYALYYRHLKINSASKKGR